MHQELTRVDLTLQVTICLANLGHPGQICRRNLANLIVEDRSNLICLEMTGRDNLVDRNQIGQANPVNLVEIDRGKPDRSQIGQANLEKQVVKDRGSPVLRHGLTVHGTVTVHLDMQALIKQVELDNPIHLKA